MHTIRILGLAMAAAALLTGAARAQSGPSRAQVEVETRAGLQAGAIPHGDLDVSSMNPSGDIHPAQAAASTLTRAQVIADLERSIADGSLQVGETGITAAEINPSHYPRAKVQGLTRDQVRRELATAQRNGDIPFGERGLTPAQLNPSRYAKAREPDDRYVQR